MNRERKAVTFVVDKSLAERLRAISHQTYIPQAKIVSLALEEYIKKLEDKKNRTNRKG